MANLSVIGGGWVGGGGIRGIIETINSGHTATVTLRAAHYHAMLGQTGTRDDAIHKKARPAYRVFTQPQVARSVFIVSKLSGNPGPSALSHQVHVVPNKFGSLWPYLYTLQTLMR